MMRPIPWLLGAMIVTGSLQTRAEEAVTKMDEMVIVENICYSEVAGGAGFGDLYLPAQPEEARPLLLIHGGAWKTMDRSRNKMVAGFLARKGFAVFNIDYRLIPQADYPACEVDCIAAAKFLLDGGHPAMKQLDRRSIVPIGLSAGGHLALMTGLKLPPEQVAGIIDISGPADLASPELRDLMKFSGMFKGQEGEEYENSLKAASPAVIADRKTLPPLLVLNSQNDQIVPVQQAYKIMEVWNKSHADLQVFLWKGKPGATHDIWRNGTPSPDLHVMIERQIAAFLETFFSKADP